MFVFNIIQVLLIAVSFRLEFILALLIPIYIYWMNFFAAQVAPFSLFALFILIFVIFLFCIFLSNLRWHVKTIKLNVPFCTTRDALKYLFVISPSHMNIFNILLYLLLSSSIKIFDWDIPEPIFLERSLFVSEHHPSSFFYMSWSWTREIKSRCQDWWDYCFEPTVWQKGGRHSHFDLKTTEPTSGLVIGSQRGMVAHGGPYRTFGWDALIQKEGGFNSPQAYIEFKRTEFEIKLLLPGNDTFPKYIFDYLADYPGNLAFLADLIYRRLSIVDELNLPRIPILELVERIQRCPSNYMGLSQRLYFLKEATLSYGELMRNHHRYSLFIHDFISKQIKDYPILREEVLTDVFRGLVGPDEFLKMRVHGCKKIARLFAEHYERMPANSVGHIYFRYYVTPYTDCFMPGLNPNPFNAADEQFLVTKVWDTIPHQHDENSALLFKGLQKLFNILQTKDFEHSCIYFNTCFVEPEHPNPDEDVFWVLDLNPNVLLDQNMPYQKYKKILRGMQGLTSSFEAIGWALKEYNVKLANVTPTPLDYIYDNVEINRINWFKEELKLDLTWPWYRMLDQTAPLDENTRNSYIKEASYRRFRSDELR